jgi:hypothetical protein
MWTDLNATEQAEVHQRLHRMAKFLHRQGYQVRAIDPTKDCMVTIRFRREAVKAEALLFLSDVILSTQPALERKALDRVSKIYISAS